MSKKTIWSGVFNILSHVFAWVIPGTYVLIVYDFFVTTQQGRFTLLALVAVIFAIRYIMYRLKITVDSGYGMEKEYAREVRFLIPLGLFLLIAIMINQNLAGLADLLLVVGISNIPASIFRLASYRLSKRYESDISSLETLKLLRDKI